MKKWMMCCLWLIPLALLLGACGGQEQPATVLPPSAPAGAVIAEGHLVPQDDLSLAFSVRGKVAEILVAEGDQVHEGEVLVRLGDREQAEAALAAAKLELVTAQQARDELVRTEGLARAEAWQAYMEAQIVRARAERDWEDLNLDNIEDRIEDREADVKDRKEDLDDAQDEFDKFKDLDEDNSKRKVAEDDLERAQEDYNEAIRDLEETQRDRDTERAALDDAIAAQAEAQHTYELTLKGPNADQLALLDARLSNAEAQVASAEDSLDQYELKAPFGGMVMEVNVSVNETVGPDQVAAIVADTSQWIVETSDLTELEVVDVAEGQPVAFTADALPGVTMRGTVEKISRTYKSQGGDILYTVRILAQEVDPRLRWGMTVEVTFKSLE